MATIKQAFTATIASGADTATIDFGAQGDYRAVYVNNEASAEIDLHGSGDGTNFYELNVRTTSNVVEWQSLTIGSALSGNYVELPPLPRYVKVIATGAVANGGTVYFSTT